MTALAVEPLQIDGEPDDKYADVLLAQVGELAVSREITSVKARLQRMNPVEEQAGYNRMFGDLVGLEKRRKALLDRAAGRLKTGLARDYPAWRPAPVKYPGSNKIGSPVTMGSWRRLVP